MGRIPNSINSGYGYNISALGPIDSRMLVSIFDDLISENTWEKHANPSGTYKGMFVAVKESSVNYPENGPGIYLLVDNDYKKPKSWQKCGGEGDGIWNEINENDIITLIPDTEDSKEGNKLGLDVFFCNDKDGAEIIEIEEKVEEEIQLVNYWKISKGSRIISPELLLPEQSESISVSAESLDPEVSGTIQLCLDYGEAAEEETWINLADLEIDVLFNEEGDPIPFRISFLNNDLDDGWEIKNITISVTKKEIVESEEGGE